MTDCGLLLTPRDMILDKRVNAKKEAADVLIKELLVFSLIIPLSLSCRVSSITVDKCQVFS